MGIFLGLLVQNNKKRDRKMTINILSTEEDKYKIVILYNEVRRIIRDDEFSSLRTEYPWLENKSGIRSYFGDLFTEEYVYESRLLTFLHDLQLETKTYTYPKGGLFVGEQRINMSSFMGRNTTNRGKRVYEYYMNSGLRSPSSSNYLYLKIEYIDDPRPNETIDLLISFVNDPNEVPEGALKLHCVNELYEELLAKKSINMDNIKFKLYKINKLFEHISCDSKHWERIKSFYNNCEDNEARNNADIRRKFIADVNYSLGIFYNRPRIAFPLILGKTLAEPSEDYTYRCISQFAIPFYSEGNSYFPHGALIINCVFPDEYIDDYIHNIVMLRNELQQLVIDNKEQKSPKYDNRQKVLKDLGLLMSDNNINFLIYKYCTYNISTIYTLDMIRDKSLFTYRGFNQDFQSQWFRTKNRNSIKPNTYYSGKIVYVPTPIAENSDDYFIMPKRQNGLIRIDNINSWRNRTSLKLYPGDKVKFLVDINWNLVEISPV